MIYVGIILGTAFSAWLLDYLLRRYVAPRISDIFENMPPFDVTVEPTSHEAEPVAIPTADGQTLTGSLILPAYGKPCGLVIFFPELNGNHAMSVKYCAGARDAGLAVLGFDFRNQGDSTTQTGYSPIHWITEYEMRDVAAVMEFVQSRSDLAALPVVAFGVSRGGVAALLAASRYPHIRSVIADSSFSTMAMARHFVDRFAVLIIPPWLYRLLPEFHIRGALRDAMQHSQQRRNCQYVHLEQELDRLAETPVLLISGTRDSYVKPDVARELQRICGPRAELWLVEGAKHNLARAVEPEEYDERVATHFRQAVEHAETRGTARPFPAAQAAMAVPHHGRHPE